MSAALELRDVAVRRGGREVLAGVSLVAPPGLVLLTGANGSGKSTLITAIAGVVPLAHGSIAVDGHDLEREGVAAKRALGWLPERNDMLEHLIAREWLALVAALRRAELEPSLALADEVLDRAALDRPIGALSAGQRRKLALVVALCGEPRLLLLDEPTNALDTVGLALLDHTITRWRAEGRTIVCALHRPERFEHTPDVRWHVDGGTVQIGV
jgi:ABC-type multidrug transport system ATPase subunit